MLYDDRHARFDHRGIIGIARHWGRIFEVVEAHMPRPTRRHRHAVRPDRLPVGEIDRDGDLRVRVARVEQTSGLVALEGAPLARAVARDVALRNRPETAPDSCSHNTSSINSTGRK